MSAVPHFGAGDATTASSAAASSLAVNKPANTADGDVLVALAYNQLSAATTTPPSGWTLVVGVPGRGGGVYYKVIPSASAETATSYTWTFSGSGRICLTIIRVTGANTSTPIDVSAAGSSVSGPTNTMPSVNATGATDLLLGFTVWNDSAATVTTVTPDAALTDGIQVCSPTTGNTSGTDIAYQALTSSGATGTRTMTTSPTATNQVSMAVAMNTAPVVTGTAALSGSGTLTAVAPGTAALSGSGLLEAHVPAAAGLSGSGNLTAHVPGPMDTWLQSSPLYVAHRGGSADWTEETLFAYTQSAAWADASTLAFEVSVWMSSDGVWVASHDQTTGRVFSGTSYDITTTPWSTLSSLTTIQGGYPIARLIDLLDAFPDRAWFVDNKGQQSLTAFFDLLDGRGGPGRFIAKQYYTASGVPTEAHNRGYKTWGYYYDADTPNIASTQSRWDLLGEDLFATTASWTAIQSYGKPVLAHIVATAANKATAASHSPAGYMASGVEEVVPQSPEIASLSGSGSLSGTGGWFGSTSFDDGTTQGWTTTTAGAGTVSITAGAAHDGAFGAAGSVPAATVDRAALTRAIAPSPQVTIAGWWQVTTEGGSSGSNVPFARLFYGGQRLADVYRQNAQPGANVWLRVTKAAGGSNYWFIGTGYTMPLNTWVYIEFKWALDGTPSVKINGTQYISAANKPSDWFSAPQIDTAYLGSQEVGNQGAWAIDSVTVATSVSSAALSGSGSLTSATAPSVPAAAALSGSGTLSGTAAVLGAAALSGSGVLTANGTPAALAPAALSGSGALTGAGAFTIAQTAVLGGTGQLSATALASIGVNLSGSGTLTCTTSLAPPHRTGYSVGPTARRWAGRVAARRWSTNGTTRRWKGKRQ